jgi:hypothetical protein
MSHQCALALLLDGHWPAIDLKTQNLCVDMDRTDLSSSEHIPADA